MLSETANHKQYTLYNSIYIPFLKGLQKSQNQRNKEEIRGCQRLTGRRSGKSKRGD